MLKDLNYWKFKRVNHGILILSCSIVRLFIYKCHEKKMWQIVIPTNTHNTLLLSIRVLKDVDISNIIINLDYLLNMLGKDKSLELLAKIERLTKYGPEHWRQYPNYIDMSKFDYIHDVGNIGVDL